MPESDVNLNKFNYMARGVSFKMRIRVKYEEAKSDNIIWYRWIKRAIDFSGEAANAQEGGRKVLLTISSRSFPVPVHGSRINR